MRPMKSLWFILLSVTEDFEDGSHVGAPGGRENGDEQRFKIGKGDRYECDAQRPEGPFAEEAHRTDEDEEP